MRDFIEITDFQDPELDVFARLTRGAALNRFEPKRECSLPKAPR